MVVGGGWREGIIFFLACDADLSVLVCLAHVRCE